MSTSLTHRPATAHRLQVALPWASTLARLVLGVVWIVAGASKVTDLAGSVRSVRAYRLLPEGAAVVVGAGLPFVEIVLGVLLIAGLATRLSSVISAVLLAGFIAGIVSASARGLRIDCGCFGGGGDLAAGQSTRYAAEIARDAGLLALAALVAWRPEGRLTVDGWLHGSDSRTGNLG